MNSKMFLYCVRMARFPKNTLEVHKVDPESFSTKSLLYNQACSRGGGHSLTKFESLELGQSFVNK